MAEEVFEGTTLGPTGVFDVLLVNIFQSKSMRPPCSNIIKSSLTMVIELHAQDSTITSWTNVSDTFCIGIRLDFALLLSLFTF